ncbi:MAG: YggT family protein [Bacillota bacterium]
MINGVLIQALQLLSLVFYWAIIVRIVIEWVYPRAQGRRDFWGILYNLTYRATEPIIQPIRRLLPDFGGLDISPLITIFLISFISRMLISLLSR